MSKPAQRPSLATVPTKRVMKRISPFSTANYLPLLDTLPNIKS